jgi:hypothetical protein
MKGRRLLITLAVAALVMGLIVVAVAPRPAPHRLPDGSLVTLTQLKFGPTNQFTHGRLLEQLLGAWIPSNGLSVATLKLQRAAKANLWYDGSPALSAEFHLSGPEIAAGRGLLLRPKFHRPFRLVILGEDDFPYVEEFERSKQYPDGVFLYVTTTAFPRSSKMLRFRLEQREDRLGPWQKVAEFSRKNPVDTKELERRPEWRPEPGRVTRTNDGINFVLGELIVAQDFTNTWDNFWQNTVTIPVQITQNGVLLTNWGLHDLRAEDSSGNSLHLGAQKSVKDSWVVWKTFRSIDPARVWRLRAGLAPDSAYAPTNLFTVHVPVPPGAPFTTNVGGYPLEVGFVNMNMLSVELLTNSPSLRLAFVGARDDSGKDIAEHSGSWSQFRFWKSLALRPSPNSPSSGAKSVTATIAISPNVPLEFTVKPRLIGSNQPPMIQGEKH